MSQRTKTDIGRHLSNASRGRIALYAVLTFGLVLYLAPLESGIMTALKSTDAVTRTAPFAPPTGEGFSLSAMETAWETLAPTMVNSIIMAVPATILSATFGSMAAFGLTGVDWRGQVAVVVLFVAAIFIPYQAVLVPLSRFWAIVGLQLWGRFGELGELIITHTAYGIPICTILFRSYYQNLSTEMLEAARLDGASTFSIYRNIVLPLSIPMFAVTLIYQFTQIWNDFLFALILTNTQSAYVVTRGLNALSGGIVTSFNTQMAGALIAAGPTLLVYVVFGDRFAKGIAAES
jgi:glucose/mannose transport system permease protein